MYNDLMANHGEFLLAKEKVQGMKQKVQLFGENPSKLFIFKPLHGCIGKKFSRGNFILYKYFLYYWMASILSIKWVRNINCNSVNEILKYFILVLFNKRKNNMLLFIWATLLIYFFKCSRTMINDNKKFIHRL